MGRSPETGSSLPQQVVRQDGPVRVDLSLAKGLRSSVLNQIVSARNAADRATSVAFGRKATMPTTRKGYLK